MADTTNLNIRIDRNLKTEADYILNKMGMNLSTAINVFVQQVVRERAIPFRIYLGDEEKIILNAKIALKEMQEQSLINGTAEMTMEEIDEEISAYRQEIR